MLPWREHDDPQKEHVTVWTVFPTSTDYFDPIHAPFTLHYERAEPGRGRVRCNRRVDSEEFRRRDADHREGNVIDENRLSNRIRRSSKAILACSETDYGDRRCAWTVVFGIDQTSRGRRHCQAPQILAGDVLRPGARGLPTVRQGLG